MGVVNNEAVLAITWNDGAVLRAKKWISKRSTSEQSLFVSVPALVDGKQTLILAPDGSKKGWLEARNTQRLRSEFIDMLNEDDSFSWIEVGWGEFGQKVLQGNNVNCYSDDEYEGG